ncbi:uncharacterized protein LOC142355725 isoform X2 [Convolutriloba macropyga]|uniref:uncharacterized protein LOC142355725 isoform X2 n=1 Tax=Convolutriloba macropyga TaxID=536237 RepID=UPI003F5288B5
MNILCLNNIQLLTVAVKRARGHNCENSDEIQFVKERVKTIFKQNPCLPIATFDCVNNLVIPDASAVCFYVHVTDVHSRSGFLIHLRLYGTSKFTALLFDSEGNMTQKGSETQTSLGVDLVWNFCPARSEIQASENCRRNLAAGKYLCCVFANLQHQDTNHNLEVLLISNVTSLSYQRNFCQQRARRLSEISEQLKRSCEK